MRRIITGATGLIGQHLTASWLQQGHEIIVIGRTVSHIQQVFGPRVQPKTWDEITPELFKSTEVIVNLAGTNIGAKRWTNASKEEVLTSRVETTKKIVEILAQLGADSPALFNASAIGIYGLQRQVLNGLPPPLDENVNIDWNEAPDFLSLVARQWEKAALPAVKSGVRVIFLRFGVVLDSKSGALPQLVRPFKFFLGGPIGSGYQPFSWVCIDDVVKAIDFLIENSNTAGPFNIVAPQCITQRVLAETIGKILHRPSSMPMPGFVLKLLFGKEKVRELLLEGQHVYPKRLTDLKFEFSYPHIELALKHLLQQ